MKTVVVDNHKLTPSKIICIGRNYAEHIEELGNEVPDDMVVFIKPNSAVADDLSAYHQEDLHYEGEVCFVVKQGKFCAVGFGLDLTKRQLQSRLKNKSLPWERAKAFDGSAVFSQFVAITSEQLNDTLSLELTIDKQLMQAGSVELMMYKPAEILAELTSFMTLNDGDIVMTGTPKGVGKIRKGSTFHGRILQDNNELISAVWVAK